MHIYAVRMALVCDDLSRDAQREFGTRFPRRLRRQWERLHYDACGSLEPHLHTEIERRCGDVIKGDVSEFKHSRVSAFEPDDWIVGPNGLYYAQRPVYAIDRDGRIEEWAFRFCNGIAKVSVHAEWNVRRVVVIP